MPEYLCYTIDMFGYIRPMECELKVREMETYRAYYCGLCRSVRACSGTLAPLLLSYDCTFLGLLLDSLYADHAAFKRVRCIHRATERNRLAVVSSPYLDYAADVQTLLFYLKCRDDWQDERRLDKGALLPLLHGANRRSAGRQQDLAARIAERLSALSRLENAKCGESDRVADIFGRLMEDVIRAAPIAEQDAPVLGWMFYNLGRFIYLIDAWDDRKKDEKGKRYNPFLITPHSAEDVRFLLSKSLEEAGKAYDLLSPKRNAALLENILKLGCPLRADRIIKGAEHEPI